MTPSAIVQRVFKLRQKAKELENLGNNPDKAPSTVPTTPSGKRRGRPPKSASSTPQTPQIKSTGGQGERAAINLKGLHDDESPTKAIRTGPAPLSPEWFSAKSAKRHHSEHSGHPSSDSSSYRRIEPSTPIFDTIAPSLLINPTSTISPKALTKTLAQPQSSPKSKKTSVIKPRVVKNGVTKPQAAARRTTKQLESSAVAALTYPIAYGDGDGVHEMGSVQQWESWPREMRTDEMMGIGD